MSSCIRVTQIRRPQSRTELFKSEIRPATIETQKMMRRVVEGNAKSNELSKKHSTKWKEPVVSTSETDGWPISVEKRRNGNKILTRHSTSVLRETGAPRERWSRIYRRCEIAATHFHFLNEKKKKKEKKKNLHPWASNERYVRGYVDK